MHVHVPEIFLWKSRMKSSFFFLSLFKGLGKMLSLVNHIKAKANSLSYFLKIESWVLLYYWAYIGHLSVHITVLSNTMKIRTMGQHYPLSFSGGRSVSDDRSSLLRNSDSALESLVQLQNVPLDSQEFGAADVDFQVLCIYNIAFLGSLSQLNNNSLWKKRLWVAFTTQWCNK